MRANASKGFQRFELKRMPLTYRSATNETGARSELTVRIGDVEWGRAADDVRTPPTGARLHAQPPTNRAETWVVFGDGVRGRAATRAA